MLGDVRWPRTTEDFLSCWTAPLIHHPGLSAEINSCGVSQRQRSLKVNVSGSCIRCTLILKNGTESKHFIF